jgi:hypothetical protein
MTPDSTKFSELAWLPVCVTIIVIWAGEYETAKARILDQHSPAAQPPVARASASV